MLTCKVQFNVSARSFMSTSVTHLQVIEFPIAVASIDSTASSMTQIQIILHVTHQILTVAPAVHHSHQAIVATSITQTHSHTTLQL
jgi:hypothetical protein